MGNSTSTSWRAKCYPDANEVTVDLSRFRAYLPYQFQTLGGTFDLPFGLGHQTLKVGDFLDMARRDIPAMARVEVSVEKKAKVVTEDELGRAAIDRLAVGMSQPILKHDSGWRKIRRLDTDVGMIVVECRVVSDVVGILKLEVQQGSWFSRGGSRLVGRAEGSLEVYVRVRFETGWDRFESRFSMWAMGTIVVVPVVLYQLLRYLASPPSDIRRLPPPSFDPGSIPGSHHATSSHPGRPSAGEPSMPPARGHFSS